MLDILFFIFNGGLGAFTSLIIRSNFKTSEILKKDNIWYLIIGLIAGYVFFLMHSEYNIPNGFMAFVFGYFAKDLMEDLTKVIKSRILKS